MARKNSSVDAVERYARDVTAGRIVAGKPVRLACERHLKDLKDGPGRGLVWDRDAAERIIRFFTKTLRLNGGKF